MVAKSKKNATSAGASQEPSFEENLKRLEEIVSKLEEGNLPLDESLKLYEEGIKAYRSCHQLLQGAETKLTKLVETLQGELKEEPFDPGRDDK